MNDDLFKQCMAEFTTGITIVSTIADDQSPIGLTVSSFNSVSLEPPLISFCIDHQTSRYQEWISAPYFAVSILSHEQQPLAIQFAQAQRDKWEGVTWLPGPATQSPLLAGALVHLECSLWQRYPAGDHDIIIGEVVAAQHHGGNALCYHRRQYFMHA
jgi:flavin reductase (DIM6/NTAB) family NADH-FMN oxidoreductase RutF